MPKRFLRNETQLLIWKVPTKLKKQFKLACFLKDTSMRIEVLRFMEQFTFDAEREESRKKAGLQ